MNSDVWDQEYANNNIVWRGPPLQDSPFESGLNILELGCGNGKNIPALIQTAASITAVDFSKNALELCRRKFLDERISFVEADVCALPFLEGSFDAASAIHILEHLLCNKRHKAVEEVHRVLKDRGVIMVRVFSVTDMRYGKGTLMEENTFCRGNGIIYHYFTENELISLFKKFQLISINTHSESKKYGNRSEICALFCK